MSELPDKPPLPEPKTKPLKLDPDVVRGSKKGERAGTKEGLLYDFDPKKHYRSPKGTRHAKHGTMQAEAKAHTVWIRHDIWEAAKLRARTERVTLRSVFETSLWHYLMEDRKDNIDKPQE